MKNAAIVALLTILSGEVAAQDLSGVWYTSTGNYVSAHQKGSTVIFAALGVQADTGGLWEAFSGTLSGNTLVANTVYGYANATLTITLTSATTLKSVQTSCTPIVAGFVCAYPNGHTITAVKIF